MEYFDIYDEFGNNLHALVPRKNCVDMLTRVNGYHIAVLVLICVNQHSIVIDQRAKPKDYGGYWEIPGGGLQAGETSKQGIMREIAEELGLSLPSQCFSLVKVFKDDRWRIIYHIYKVELENLDINALTIQPQELACVKLLDKSKMYAMMAHDHVLRFDKIIDLVDQLLN